MRAHDERTRDARPATRHEEACDGCPLRLDRRSFLRDAALAAAATLVAAGAIGASPAEALAERVRAIAPRRAAGRMLSYAIPPADGVSIDSGNDVILARWQGRVYAFSLRCPHRGTRLQWRPDEGRIFCPKHKARFRTDGAHDSGRNTRALDRYAVSRQGGTIAVGLDTLYRVDTDPAAWNAAVVQLA